MADAGLLAGDDLSARDSARSAVSLLFVFPSTVELFLFDVCLHNPTAHEREFGSSKINVVIIDQPPT